MDNQLDQLPPCLPEMALRPAAFSVPDNYGHSSKRGAGQAEPAYRTAQTFDFFNYANFPGRVSLHCHAPAVH